MQIGKHTYHVRSGDLMLIPPHTPHRLIIHSPKTPYRRFVFWISRDYCNHLLQSSPDYAYIMQYVATEKRYIFHTDQVAFNAIQSIQTYSFYLRTKYRTNFYYREKRQPYRRT